MPRDKSQKPRDYFTKLSDGQIRGLLEATASGNERAAYEFASRFHNDPDHPSRFWVKAELAEERIGMRADVFSRALRRLCKKCFYIGRIATPVLTKVADGHNGRPATYDDNLYRATCLDRTYPESSKARLPTNNDEVARQDCPPTQGE